MRFEMLHPADQLVMMLDRIYHYGMTTTSGGNLSVLDDNGDIWITPSGIDKGSLTRRDIMQVKPDGTVIGPHTPSVELPFHRHIYKLRPDIRAIVHAHPPTLVAFSLARKNPDFFLTPEIQQLCGRVDMEPYAVPGSERLGDYIAEKFAEGCDSVMMENHGVVCGAANLEKAFMAFETLDFSARTELNAKKIGTPRHITPEQIAFDGQVPALPAFNRGPLSSEEAAARRDLCAFSRRCYDQHLFTAAAGAFSYRLEDGSFVITPEGMDRKYLEEQDLVLVKDGHVEEGKTADRTVLLHAAIYAKNPAVRSVVISKAPCIMAFACTEADFDSRTIPESYIALRNVKRQPFGAALTDPEGVAAQFSAKVPVMFMENQYAVATGASLIKAFDCMEVLEYSAKALIMVPDIGKLVTISPEEVRQIEIDFNL